MSIRFECSECDRSLKVRDDLAGRKIRCPDCEAVLRVPDADGEDEFFSDTDSDADAGPPKRTASAARSQASPPRVRRPRPDDDSPGRFHRMKSKSSKSKQGNGIPLWAIVAGAGVVGVVAIGGVVMLAIQLLSSIQPTGQVASAGAAPANGQASAKYVPTETDSNLAKFKMKWEMPAGWKQESEIEDGMWPWATMKGDGQTIKLVSNRSLTEMPSTMTSMGGFMESLKTAHTVRIAKLQAEYIDYQEGPLNIHEGSQGPVIWSSYDYKGVFGRGYGIRCTIVGPKLPCTLTMECPEKARDKWQPVLLHVAGSVYYEKTDKDGDDDMDFLPGGVPFGQ